MKEIQDMLAAGAEAIDTNVDLIFVIDATGSMKPTIDMVKKSALSFHEGLSDYLKTNKRIVKNLRVKVVWFRDFYFDGDFAYGESEFFELPGEQEDFHDFVANINAAGGGDDPECGLEALTLAMRSHFVEEGDKKRHIIVLFSDAGAHAFEDYERLAEEAGERGCSIEMYPENMPKTLGEFESAWQGDPEYQGFFGSDGEPTRQNPKYRRMVIVAPCAYPWTAMEDEMEHTIRVPFEALGNGTDIGMDQVYPLILSSMS